MPEDPFRSYGTASSVAIGMIHGVGAETPTQVLLFLSAAGVGGRAAGIAVLVVFLVGLFIANSAVALASTFGYLNASRNFGVYATVAAITGGASLVMGALFLLGQGSVLPTILGG